MKNRKVVEAIGYSALGLGFWFQAAKAAGVLGGEESGGSVPVTGLRAPRLAGLGDEQTPEARALQTSRPVFSRVTTRTVTDIKDRVSYIQDRVRKDSLKPEIKEKALAVLTRKIYEDTREPYEPRANMPTPDTVQGLGYGENFGRTEDGRKVVWAVPPKDYEAEIVALYTAVQDPASPVALRYTRDHAEVDQYVAAEKLLRLPGGDCDDGTILLGAMLRSVGYPIRMRVIQDTQSSTWSHIYLLAGMPPMRPDKWIPLDWSVVPYKPAGWEAPGAKEVAKYGKPSGVVTKLMDFAV